LKVPIVKKCAQVVVLRTEHGCVSSDTSYENIASLGSGNVFDVNKGDISKVLEFVKTSMDTNRVNLMSVNIPQKQLIPFPKKLSIDESIRSLQVSVSGLNSNIDVVNPIGRKMDESNGLITDLNLKNVKIINILVSFSKIIILLDIFIYILMNIIYEGYIILSFMLIL